jgi:ankyrin repeat protein
MKNAICILAILLPLSLLPACSAHEEANTKAAQERRESLFEAVEDGDLDKLSELRPSGTDLSARANLGHTLLHKAAGTGKGGKDVVQYLLQAGADLRIWDEDGCTPVHCAIAFDNADLVHIFLANGIQPNFADPDGRTLLHYAVLVESYECVEFLISKGADINALDKEGYTPLDFALRSMQSSAHAELPRRLYQRGARPSKVEPNVLTATACQDTETLKRLLAGGSDVNVHAKDGPTALHVAVTFGKTEYVNLLIKNGAELNAKAEWEMTPLHLAVYYEHAEIAKLLIAYGAALDIRDWWGMTPLHRAVPKSKKVAVLLIAAGCDVNARTKEGRTPLHFANSKEFAQLLISAGADVNALDNKGDSPLDGTQTDELSEFLRSHGAVSGKELKGKKEE